MTDFSSSFYALALLSLCTFACSGGEESSPQNNSHSSGGASSLGGDSGTGGEVASSSGGGETTSTPLDETHIPELCDLSLQKFGTDRAMCEYIVVALSSALGEDIVGQGTLEEIRSQCAERVDQCLLNAEELNANALSDCHEQLSDPACSATVEEVMACYDAQALSQEAHQARAGTCATSDFMTPEEELALGIADECIVVAVKCPGFWGPE